MVWISLTSQTLSIPQCQSLLVPILKAISAIRGTERVRVARLGLAAVPMDVCYTQVPCTTVYVWLSQCGTRSDYVKITRMKVTKERIVQIN